jgi:dTDP-4-dehydrorhamnose 3,5-epimerase
MAVAVERFEIDGLVLARPEKFLDSRGYFVSTYDQRQYRDVGIACNFVKDNQSLSRRRGTIRGLHFQVPPAAQAKLVRVSRGSIFDVAVDLRKGSPTYGRWRAVTLSAEDGAQFFLPAGFAHGFCTLEADTEVAYKTDAFYAPECDKGLRWNDPDIAIAWPAFAVESTLSDKDANLPAFRTFVSPFTM